VSHAGARVLAPVFRSRAAGAGAAGAAAAAAAVSFSWCSSLFPLAPLHLTDILTQLTEGN